MVNDRLVELVTAAVTLEVLRETLSVEVYETEFAAIEDLTSAYYEELADEAVSREPGPDVNDYNVQVRKRSRSTVSESVKFFKLSGDKARKALSKLPKDTVGRLPRTPLWFVNSGDVRNPADRTNRVYKQPEYAFANRFPNQSTFGPPHFEDAAGVSYRVATHAEAAISGVRTQHSDRALLYVKFPRQNKGRALMHNLRSVKPTRWRTRTVANTHFQPGTTGSFAVKRSWVQPKRRTGWVVV